MILALSLMGFLPASCSKSSTAKSTGTTASVAATNAVSPNEKNLGVLKLTDHHETTIDLGLGRSCRITPALLDRKDLQLTMALETKTANGGMAGLNVLQVVTTPDKPLDISIGALKITMTPSLQE